MSKYDYDHCQSCSAPLTSYSDVFCMPCRERVNRIVRKLAMELDESTDATTYYRPCYIRDRNKGAEGD